MVFVDDEGCRTSAVGDWPFEVLEKEKGGQARLASQPPPGMLCRSERLQSDRETPRPQPLETAETWAQVYSYFLLLLSIFSIDS